MRHTTHKWITTAIQFAEVMVILNFDEKSVSRFENFCNRFDIDYIYTENGVYVDGFLVTY